MPVITFAAEVIYSHMMEFAVKTASLNCYAILKPMDKILLEKYQEEVQGGKRGR